MSHLATAIGLVDLGTVHEVHLGVFRPGVLTLACSIHRGIRHQDIPLTHACDLIIILDHFLLNDRHVDVHSGIEGTALVVITSINGSIEQRNTFWIAWIGIGIFHVSRVIDQGRRTAVVVHIRLIDIAGRQDLCAVGTAEDTANLNG